MRIGIRPRIALSILRLFAAVLIALWVRPVRAEESVAGSRPAREPRSRAFSLLESSYTAPLLLLSEIHPTDLEGELQFEYDWGRQETSVRQGAGSRFEKMSFTERLRLVERWFVLDPRALHFTTGGTLGFFQERFSFGNSERESGSSRVRLLGYDLNGTLLQGRPYPVSFLASRTTDTVTREFAGTSEVFRESSGASLDVREVLPVNSHLRVHREKIRQRLRFASLFDTREEERRTASYLGTWYGEVTDVDAGYEFNDVDDRSAAGLKFQTHDAHLSHFTYFGPYLEKSLSSRVSAFQRVGQTESGRFDENLTIDHSDAFSTRAQYSANYVSVENLQTLSHLGFVGLRHQLFRSLTSNVQAQATSVDFEQGRTLGYGGAGNLSYSKSIPLSGHFASGASLSYRIDDQEVGRGEVLVVGEQHTFPSSQRFFLANPRVVVSSIVITDASRTIVYQEGFDYLVREFGDRTEVERIPSGRIDEGQPLLVDYRFITAPALRFGSLSHGFNLGLDYDWIYLFFSRNRSSQDLLSGSGSEFLDRVAEDTMGARLSWSKRGISADARNEYRIYESRRLSYNSTIFEQSVSLLPNPFLSLSTSHSLSLFRFSNPERSSTAEAARGGLFWNPDPRISMDCNVNFLRLEDSLAPDERFFGGGARVRIVSGRLSLSPFFSYGLRDVGGGESRDLQAGVSLTRALF